jgi:hypothetical protein
MANEKNLKPFKKGNKAAAGHGRPVGSRSIKALFEEVIDTTISFTDPFTKEKTRATIEKAIVVQTVVMAAKGCKHARECVFDYVYGKPVQKIESENQTKLDIESIDVSKLTNEQLKSSLDYLMGNVS